MSRTRSGGIVAVISLTVVGCGPFVLLDISRDQAVLEYDEVIVFLNDREVDCFRSNDGSPLVPFHPSVLHRGYQVDWGTSTVHVVERVLLGNIEVGKLEAEWSGATVTTPIKPPDDPLGGGHGGAGGAGGAGGTGGATGMGGMVGSGAGGSGGTNNVAPDGGPDLCFFGDAGVDYDCPMYCTKVQEEGCLEQLYTSASDCLETCSSFGWKHNNPVGSANENTIECRTRQVGISCASGSAYGGGRCPQNRCMAYCDAMIRYCAASLELGEGGDAMSQCLAACTARGWFPSIDDGRLISIGDSGECRLYWAGQAGRVTADSPERMSSCANASAQSQQCQ